MSNENLNENFNDSHWEPTEAFSLGLKLGLSLPYIQLMLIALIGNSLVCYVIHRYLQHSVTNIFLYNLSLTDILTTLAVIPISAVADIWLNHWPFGEAMCKIVPFIQCLTVTLTAFTHVLISCDRFLIVFWPLQRRQLLTPRKAKFILLGLWLTASIQAIPNAVVGYLERGESLRCAESWDQEQSKAYTLTLMVIQYFLPLVLLIFSYSVIVWKLNSTQVGGVISVSRSGMAVRSKRKVVKMMIAVSTIYAISQLPRHVIYLYGTIVEWNSRVFAIAWTFSTLLSSSASCYNPFIYAWMNQTYRMGFSRVLCFCCNKWKKKDALEVRIKSRPSKDV
ncbi:unnamed protein product [Rodentolepis nana]|uniref:G_PROTEIN_RECEP_F1_2 domain-containing protein n=1 Tax=Rodentolepis nana TaxID=102285 RepID=A0A0R3TQ59_RODNA|nr:unnamed protein product [Rodentolepis nana]